MTAAQAALLALEAINDLLEGKDDELTLVRMRCAIDSLERLAQRREVFRADVREPHVVRYVVGACGQGADRRVVESGFDVRAGDQIIVTREDR